jgi:hypothetical protein
MIEKKFALFLAAPIVLVTIVVIRAWVVMRDLRRKNESIYRECACCGREVSLAELFYDPIWGSFCNKEEFDLYWKNNQF